MQGRRGDRVQKVEHEAKDRTSSSAMTMAITTLVGFHFEEGMDFFNPLILRVGPFF
jgi:hypothetical protein